jgi:hypothetical protein
MPNKKKSTKTRREKFVKQAKANLKNALKTQQKLELELKKVKEDLDAMAIFRHGGPTYSNCPPGM